MRLPPGVSSRKLAWPSQVSAVAIRVLSHRVRRERTGGAVRPDAEPHGMGAGRVPVLPVSSSSAAARGRGRRARRSRFYALLPRGPGRGGRRARWRSATLAGRRGAVTACRRCSGLASGCSCSRARRAARRCAAEPRPPIGARCSSPASRRSLWPVWRSSCSSQAVVALASLRAPSARTAARRGAPAATSISGCTAKNEPTVTTSADETALGAASSRGGEPPTGASRSSAAGAHVHRPDRRRGSSRG